MGQAEAPVTGSELAELDRRGQVYFALFCVRQVEHLIDKCDKPAWECLQVIYRWLNGEATKAECEKAADDIYEYTSLLSYVPQRFAIESIRATARIIYAQYAWSPAELAQYTGFLATSAVVMNRRDTFRKEQRGYYNELLNIDQSLESIILKGEVI